MSPDGRNRGLVALGLLLPLLLAGPATASRGTQGGPDDVAPVQVEVTELAPRAPLASDEQLRVSGRLVNTGDVPVSDLSVRLLVGSVIDSRSGLARADDADSASGRPRGEPSPPMAVDLAPGGATSFDLQALVGDLRLGRVGVYPVQVQVRGRLDEARRTSSLGLASTFVPWFPDGAPSPTRLSFLWPLVADPARTPDGAVLGGELLNEVSDGGRLARLLAAAVAGAAGACDPDVPPPAPPAPPAPADPAVPPPPPPPPAPPPAPCRGEPVPLTYAIDPELLEAVQTLAGDHLRTTAGGDRTPAAGEPAAQQWRDAVIEALTDEAGTGAALLALPFADPDVVAAARTRSGLPADVEQLRLLGLSVAAELTGVEPVEDLAWPPDGRLSAAALDTIADAGATAVVLDADAMPLGAGLLSRTPGARTPLGTTVTGPVDGLVEDAELSRLLTVGPDDDGWQGERLAEQRWLAETAILAAERPDESRTIVVALPRDADVVPGVAAAALHDAGRLPWLCAVPLPDVAADRERCPTEPADAPPDRVEDRGELQPADGTGELSPLFLQQVADVRARAEQLTDDVLVPGDAALQTKARLLRARGRSISTAWRDEPVGGRLMLALQREEVDRLRSQVQLVTSGRVLLTSDTGVVEVGLANALDQPVTVGIALNDPVEARLTSSDTGVQTVAAGQQVQVRVRVEARVSGQFVVRATLLDRAGRPFGEPVELVARSTRYGRLALAVTGVAAGVLLVAVGVRLTRRAMRSTAAMPGPGE